MTNFDKWLSEQPKTPEELLKKVSSIGKVSNSTRCIRKCPAFLYCPIEHLNKELCKEYFFKWANSEALQ